MSAWEIQPSTLINDENNNLNKILMFCSYEKPILHLSIAEFFSNCKVLTKVRTLYFEEKKYFEWRNVVMVW
jgi:hypothetical protein